MMGFGHGPFGRQLGLGEVMNVGPSHDGISALVRRDTRELVVSLSAM